MYEYIGILLGSHPILRISRIRVKATVQELSGHHCDDRDFTKNHPAVYYTSENLQLTQRHYIHN
jgi:hypothetical protein